MIDPQDVVLSAWCQEDCSPMLMKILKLKYLSLLKDSVK